MPRLILPPLVARQRILVGRLRHPLGVEGQLHLVAHLGQGQIVPLSQGHQIVVLRLVARRAPRQRRPLQPQRAEGGVQLQALTRQTPAGLQQFPQPQRRAVAPPHLAQGRRPIGRHQGREQEAVASFLHHDRLAEHLQGAGLPQGRRQEGQILRRGVINLGLLLLHQLLLFSRPIRSARGGLKRLGQDQPQQVGAIQAMAAQTHPHLQGQGRRRRPEALGPAGHQGQPRRRGEFGRGETAAAGKGNGPQPGDLQHRWRR